MSKEVVFIDASKLIPNDIVRADIESKTFAYHIDVLKSSIEAQGVLTPLLVTPHDGLHLIVDGNRRYAAGVSAGLKEFPCIVVNDCESGDGARITEIGFSANELRQDLTPSQEIDALKRVCEKGDMTLEQIAEATGKTVVQLETISARKRLHPDIIKMMDEGEISRSASNRLTSLPHKEQVEVVETFRTMDIPVTQDTLRLYRGHRTKPDRLVSPKVLKKLNENIGLHASELEKLKKVCRALEKEVSTAHKLIQRIWKVPELHDYLRDHHPAVFKDFQRVLKALGF